MRRVTLQRRPGTVNSRSSRDTETVTTRYFHTDHLGSVAVITNEAGGVVERLSHDAWGKRRFPNGADDPAGGITSLTTAGFTGQEELSVGLVHLNGRVYDPMVARMLSADPVVPDPFNAQAWNRYSYRVDFWRRLDGDAMVCRGFVSSSFARLAMLSHNPADFSDD